MSDNHQSCSVVDSKSFFGKVFQKKLSCFLTVLVIFLSIGVDEGINTILMESVVSLANRYSWLLSIYVLSTMPFAIFLASWSDFHCRRKVLIFTLFFTIFSCGLMSLYNIYGYNWLAFLSLLLKATGGNVIPIALAALADITKMEKFRSRLALALVTISLGFWVPIYFRPEDLLIFHFTQYGFVAAILVAILVILFFKDKSFDGITFQKNVASLRGFISFSKKDIKLIYLFLFSPMVLVGMLAFISSETSYYQFLLRGEILEKSGYFSFQSFILAIGYYVGTVLLIFLGVKKVFDITCIKIGLWMSFFSLILTLIIHSMTNNNILHESLSIGGFSAGVALFTPSLFAALSKAKSLGEQGKIFGLLESTDSLAIFFSYLIIGSSKYISYSLVSFITLILFLLSCTLYLIFIKIYKESMLR